jgi:hypothetical protein
MLYARRRAERLCRPIRARIINARRAVEYSPCDWNDSTSLPFTAFEPASAVVRYRDPQPPSRPGVEMIRFSAALAIVLFSCTAVIIATYCSHWWAYAAGRDRWSDWRSMGLLSVGIALFRGVCLAGGGVTLVYGHFPFAAPIITGRMVWTLLAFVELVFVFTSLTYAILPLAWRETFMSDDSASQKLIAANVALIVLLSCPVIVTMSCVIKYSLVLYGVVQEPIAVLDVAGVALGLFWTTGVIWRLVAFLRNPFHGL